MLTVRSAKSAWIVFVFAFVFAPTLIFAQIEEQQWDYSTDQMNSEMENQYEVVAEEEVPIEPIFNFGRVSSGIYRSAQPTEAQFGLLAENSFRTIINLRNDMRLVEQERQWVEGLGMKYVSVPMNGFSMPDQRNFKKVLEIMNDPANHPVLVHCQMGKERTGVAVALYRLKYQHWRYVDAEEEMFHYGYDMIWFGHLKRYVYEHTKMSQRPPVKYNVWGLVEETKSDVLLAVYSAFRSLGLFDK